MNLKTLASLSNAYIRKYEAQHAIGEWFKLNNADLAQFEQVCKLLGGNKYTGLSTVSVEATEEAEVIGEIISEDGPKVDKFNYEQMVNDGWRIELFSRNDRKYWIWRKGSHSNRKAMYGGRLDDMPPQFKEAFLKSREDNVSETG